MIKKFSIESIGEFRKKTEFEFSKNINVFLGKNATGKSIILKFLYSSLAFLNNKKQSENKEILNHNLSEKIKNVFLIEKIGKLSTRKQGRIKSKVEVFFANNNFAFSFSTKSHKAKIEVIPDNKIGKSIFIPTKEILSIMDRGFIGIYDNYEKPFMEEIYYDLAKKLDEPMGRGRNVSKINKLLKLFKIEDIQLGRIYREQNTKEFIAYIKGIGNIESKLLAEGYRKIETIVFLLKNGQLTNGSYLFWDEPEANLNPSLMKSMVDFIVNLSQEFNIQIFLSTHNYFLLKYLNFKNNSKKQPVKFFSLRKEKDTIEVSASTDIYLLENNEIIDEFETLLKNENFLLID